MSVVTFLFTDIEGSTRRWEADPEAMRVALETHNHVLRGTVEANDGRMFNYTGEAELCRLQRPQFEVES